MNFDINFIQDYSTDASQIEGTSEDELQLIFQAMMEEQKYVPLQPSRVSSLFLNFSSQVLFKLQPNQQKYPLSGPQSFLEIYQILSYVLSFDNIETVNPLSSIFKNLLRSTIEPQQYFKDSCKWDKISLQNYWSKQSDHLRTLQLIISSKEKLYSTESLIIFCFRLWTSYYLRTTGKDLHDLQFQLKETYVLFGEEYLQTQNTRQQLKIIFKRLEQAQQNKKGNIWDYYITTNYKIVRALDDMKIISKKKMEALQISVLEQVLKKNLGQLNNIKQIMDQGQKRRKLAKKFKQANQNLNQNLAFLKIMYKFYREILQYMFTQLDGAQQFQNIEAIKKNIKQ